MQIIYPGTFNPFHQGHTAVIMAALQHLPGSHVVVVPTAMPPHRLQDVLAPAHHRLAMAKLALQNLPDVSVSDVECNCPGPHYTAVTLQALANGQTLALLMGRDAIISLPTWHQADWLAKHAQLIAVNRGQNTTQPNWPVGFKTKLPLIWLPTPVHPASATAIREMIRQNSLIPKNWLHPAAEAYIRQHHLYVH
jgi:nicotinate-nucleotide adenylyltransferase